MIIKKILVKKVDMINKMVLNSNDVKKNNSSCIGCYFINNKQLCCINEEIFILSGSTIEQRVTDAIMTILKYLRRHPNLDLFKIIE